MTLRVDTIENTSGGAVTLTNQSAAKAWVNFNGTGTIAARDSLNVSGLVDNATGEYAVNLTNSMANANYAYSALNGGALYSEVLPAAGNYQANPNITTSSYTIIIRAGATRYDDTYILSQMHGDLA